VQRLIKNRALSKNGNMKPAFVGAILFFAFTIPVMQSCCKAVCTDDEIFAIDFQGFSATEMEKIKVLRFDHDNLTVPVDSFNVRIGNVFVNTSTRVYLDTTLKSDFIYKINVEKAGLVYTLSDFQTEKDKCSCEPGTYEKLLGYKLNGVQVSAQDKWALEIKK
jgi:hypothetical protein